MADSKKKTYSRQEIEAFILKGFDIIDKSGANSKYYKELMANMTDAQFKKFISKKYPFRFQQRQGVTEPTMDDIIKACDYTGVPLIEDVYLPYLYENKDGEPVKAHKCFVGYQHHKKVQQFVSKKSKWGVETSNRDMKGGRLLGNDKGAAISDREFEGFATLELYNSMYEFSRPRADSMRAKDAMYAAISTKGFVTQADIPNEDDDMLSRGLIDAYMTSALLDTNLLHKDGYTAYTLKKKRQQLREQ